MQIWRMHPDGSNQEQVTFDEYNNWFAHPSPDGKWIVYLTYEKDVEGHLRDKDIMLRIMPAAGGEPRILASFFGGQGTINVPSWSPDSTQIAYVRYQPAVK
jgi:Tol biopolymer transport system component